MGIEQAGPSRRAVVRGAAWSVPVVAVATPVPVFAASPCVLRSEAVSTTNNTTTTFPAQGYTRDSSTAGRWRTSTPTAPGATYTNARIAITATKTGLIQHDFSATIFNLVAFTTGGVSGVSINQRPSPQGSVRGYDQRTVTRFDFGRLVYNLTFTIADISKSGSPSGVVNFWDTVQVTSDGSYQVTARQATVQGSGTQADPFTPIDSSPDGGDTDPQNVTLQFTTRATYVTFTYWSAAKGTTTTAAGGQGVTISNMTMQLAPDGCV